MPAKLSKHEQDILLEIAMTSLQAAVFGKEPPQLDLTALPVALSENGASFVTLTKAGELRGCIGALLAYQPLALDVQEHAVQAALEDTRFPPVRPEELNAIEVEVSYLNTPVRLPYQQPTELPKLLRPHIDGVILADGFRRATFLPQVWEQLPDLEDFLSHLCAKMGASPDLWRRKVLEVSTYQVQEFK